MTQFQEKTFTFDSVQQRAGQLQVYTLTQGDYNKNTYNKCMYSAAPEKEIVSNSMVSYSWGITELFYYMLLFKEMNYRKGKETFEGGLPFCLFSNWTKTLKDLP